MYALGIKFNVRLINNKNSNIIHISVLRLGLSWPLVPTELRLLTFDELQVQSIHIADVSPNSIKDIVLVWDKDVISYALNWYL